MRIKCKNCNYYIHSSVNVNLEMRFYNFRKLVTDPNLEPDVIVTTEENSSNLKKMHPNVDCVDPTWIWTCHNKQKYLATKEFSY